MNTSHIRLAFFVALAFFAATRTWSAAHGIYPGLSNLIGNSQWIVVASVQSRPASPRTHSQSSRASQKVRVLYVLKGDVAPEDELNVALDSEILFPTRTYLEVDDYPIYERYVLFMSRDTASPRNFTVLNSVGSAFWIPRETDLSALKPGGARGNIEALLNGVLEYSESREEALNERIQEFLED